MTTKALVSVIVVADGDKALLSRCVDSILKQTLRQIEVLIVEDRTSCELVGVAEDYAQRDERVRFLRVDVDDFDGFRKSRFDANGEFVAYINAHDWIDERYLEKLYEAISRTGADIACAGVEVEGVLAHNKDAFEIKHECLIHEMQAKFDAVNCPNSFMIQNKLFRNSFLKQTKIHMHDRSLLEMSDFLIRTLYEANSLVTVSEVKYHRLLINYARMEYWTRKRYLKDVYLSRKRFVIFADRIGLQFDVRLRTIIRRKIELWGKTLLTEEYSGRRITYRLFGLLPVWHAPLGVSVREEDSALAAWPEHKERMTIAFDAKRITHNATGLGNYGRMMVDMLVKMAPDNRYLLYTPDPGRDDLRRRSALPHVTFCYPERHRRGMGKALWRSLGVCREIPAHTSLFHGLSGELPLWLGGTGIHSVVTIHDLIFLRYPSYYKFFDRKIYAYKYRRACEIADRIIAISETTKQDIMTYFHIPEEKIDVVYQGCDKSFKQPVSSEAKRLLREKYNLPEHFILYVGSIEERKNLLLVVKALARIGEPLHVVALGKHTPYEDEVRKFAEENNLMDRLHIFNGVLFSELPVFYQMADVFVYPSRFEGFGIPMIEAANCGVPTIGATGSCLEEAGGPDAMYVNPDDPKELAQCIQRVLHDPELAQKMVERGKAYVARFEPDVLAKDLLTVYEKVVKA